MFDPILRDTPLPNWVDAALAQRLSAPNFPQSLGQTTGISDPHCAGGRAYALALAHALLCQAPQSTSAGVGSQQGRACGHCSQCALLKAGNHPDLMCLVPENLQLDFTPEKEKKPSKTIKIEQLRALESNFNLTSQRGGRKVVLIYPAQTLGTVPANALLKTLEDPPPNTFFIVVSEVWPQVLPTIRSRCVCQTLLEPSLADKVAWLEACQVRHPKRWLELSAGRVDKALAMAQDPLWLPLLKLMPYLLQGARTDAIGLANDMSKAELKRVVEVLSLWMVDLLAVGQGASARFFAGQAVNIGTVLPSMNLAAASDFASHLSHIATMADHTLNARTQCEALLLSYQSLFKP